jgi:TonB family protein
MFEKSHTLGKYRQSSKVLRMNLGYVPYIEPETKEDKRPMKIAIALAIVVHVVFFAMTIPEGRETPMRIGKQKSVYVVKQVRFKPPPPRAEQQIPQKKERKRVIPIPDPTPEEPEPIRVAEIEAPEVDLVGDSDVIFGIPEGPPGPGTSGGPALRMDGNITPPVKIHAPTPRYTEEGRQSRVQGVVILEAIIDDQGNVDSVKVLKGLPHGLSESAVATAREWKYKPAMLDGEPVAVFFNLTIRFSLQ